MIQILYTLYFWLIVIPVFGIATILTATIVFIGCSCGGERFFAYYPGMIWSKFTCYLALCPVKVYGREQLNRKQSYVFVANHQGAFDIFLLYGFIGFPIKWMMKLGLAKLPFVGAACRSAGFIFVDHSTPQAARRSILDAERQLRKGASLVVFPEGSRSRTGKMSRFRRGAFAVAQSQGLPVVPVTINGSYNVLKRGGLKVRPHRLEMIIHQPLKIDPENDVKMPGEKSNLQSFTDKVYAIIENSLWNEFKLTQETQSTTNNLK